MFTLILILLTLPSQNSTGSGYEAVHAVFASPFSLACKTGSFVIKSTCRSKSSRICLCSSCVLAAFKGMYSWTHSIPSSPSRSYRGNKAIWHLCQIIPCIWNHKWLNQTLSDVTCIHTCTYIHTPDVHLHLPIHNGILIYQMFMYICL